MPETTFQEMKRYVRFTGDDTVNLAAFGAVASPHFVTIAAEFYDRIREHEAAHAVFADEAQILRLRASLVRWMQRLCDGPHDEAYFVERAKIGRMHVKIGLPQRYMFTAMALIRVSFERLADTMPREIHAAVHGSIARVLDLELAIMLETYNEDFAARLQRIERADRERLERALARSEHRYVNAVELAKVLVVGLDSAGRISLFNREAERVTGFARDEVLGQLFAGILLPEEIRERESARLLRGASGGGVTDDAWEMPTRTRAGKLRVIRWHLAYVPNPTDEDVVLFAIGADVTDERALHERTLRSEKLAAVGTLAAGLAHEIRNPLNGALLHVTFLERALHRGQGGERDALDAVKSVGTEIRRLSDLVRDFLVFARPSPLRLEDKPVREVIQHVVDLSASDAAAAGVRLQTEFGSNESIIRADFSKLAQALLNLVRNGIEAAGGTRAGVVTVRSLRIPHSTVIEVDDDGPGLPSPDAPIFDAFYSTKPDGTGLGLAIVHRVVSDHGGTLEVESRPGKTVFRITLPINISESREAP